MNEVSHEVFTVCRKGESLISACIRSERLLKKTNIIEMFFFPLKIGMQY